eukprot:COSAG03_NODE_2812_length_2437_cov_2.946536_2_plen_175_part_00
MGKACRRGSLRWLLLRAYVSCDAQQLIAISHRAPNWTSASLLRPSRLPVATPAASQPPHRASWRTAVASPSAAIVDQAPGHWPEFPSAVQGLSLPGGGPSLTARSGTQNHMVLQWILPPRSDCIGEWGPNDLITATASQISAAQLARRHRCCCHGCRRSLCLLPFWRPFCHDST